MLRVKELRCSYLRASGLSIAGGQAVAVCGSSGAGKTIFLKAIADLLSWSGRINLDGVCSSDLPAFQWRRNVMYVSSKTSWWAPSVEAHMEEHPELNNWLHRLNFDNAVLAMAPDELSTGQQQRLALLRAMSREPRVLLLDEPTANLDTENVRRVELLISQWVADNRIVLFTSHDTGQVSRLSDVQWQIENGRVREVG